ncbi:hypothetical protein [Shinella sp.]|uniref:hypothetical protein n=1 Tax=Shinella sp. TaxID=1870904 RepID=UPI0025834CFF|nr:hypothetical protein [Shinella sp.]
MVEQVFGTTIVGTATSLLPTAGIVFLPFADEPELVPFSAVWSSFNRELRPDQLEWVQNASDIATNVKTVAYDLVRAINPPEFDRISVFFQTNRRRSMHTFWNCLMDP